MLIKYNLDDKGTGHVFERKELHVMENSKYQRIEISDNSKFSDFLLI